MFFLSDASVIKVGAVASSANMLQFKVQSQNRSSVVSIFIRAEDAMIVLMEKYSSQTSYPLTNLTFMFDGEILREDDTPTSLDLEGGECIDVHIKN